MKIFDFVEDNKSYDIQTQQKLFKDVMIDNDTRHLYNNDKYIKIIEGNFVYFVNIDQIIYFTEAQKD